MVLNLCVVKDASNKLCGVANNPYCITASIPNHPSQFIKKPVPTWKISSL
jgi:hypothetical protein